MACIAFRGANCLKARYLARGVFKPAFGSLESSLAIDRKTTIDLSVAPAPLRLVHPAVVKDLAKSSTSDYLVGLWRNNHQNLVAQPMGSPRMHPSLRVQVNIGLQLGPGQVLIQALEIMFQAMELSFLQLLNNYSVETVFLGQRRYSLIT